MRSPRSGPLLCGSSRSGRHLGPLPRGLRSTPRSPRSLWPPSPSTVAVLGLPVSMGTSLRWGTGPPGRPPQERRASGDRWPGAARASRAAARGARATGTFPHVAPRPRPCSLSRLPGWSRLVLGPPEHDLHPGSSPIPGCLSQRPVSRLGPGAWLPGWWAQKEAVDVISPSACVGGCGLRVRLPAPCKTRVSDRQPAAL